MQTARMKGARLSKQQERLWNLQQEEPIYQIQSAVQLDGELVLAVLQTALQQVVQAHDILRTRFVLLPNMEIPVQAIMQQVEVWCPLIDVQYIAPKLQEDLLLELFSALQLIPFNVQSGPLLRIGLFRLATQKHVLFVSLPALCADTTTLFLLLDQTVRRYQACLQGQIIEDQQLQYTTVSTWQQTLCNDESAQIPTEFWRKVDLTMLAKTSLPFEHIPTSMPIRNEAKETRKAPRSYRKYSLELPQAVSNQLMEMVGEEGPEFILLTTWAIVLWRLTDQPTLLLGLGCDGRGFEELNEALGPYARMLPLSLSLDPFASFHDTLLSLRSRISSARAWQAYFSWPDLPSFHDHAAPFFPLAFSYQAWPDLLPSPFSLRLFHHSALCEPSCLLLSAVLHHGLLHLHLHADAALFSSQTLARLSRFFHTCLSHALLHPHTPLALLPLLPLTPPAPLPPLLETPPASSLSHLFLAHVEQTPDAIALLTPHTHLSFLALQQRVAQLAHLLRQHDIGPHCLVALWMERSPEQIIALLAILETGAAYLPLDPHAPLPRLLYQIRHSAAHLLLAHTHLLPRHDPAWSESPCPLLTWEQCVPRLSTLPTHALSLPPDEQALAYLIYTSGSTGQPKGVLVEQRSLLHYLHAIAERLHPQPCWRYGNVSTLAADLGHTVLFLPLLLGGCLLLPDYETFTVGQRWQRWSREQGIDVLKLVPSHLAALLNPDDEQAADSLPTQLLLLGGEPLPTSLVERVRRTGATCRIYNHYGPTETTVGVLLHALEDPLPAGPVALGSPLGQTRLFVVDHWGQQVPQGVIGELCIGGPAVARGYHGESALTAQAFVPDGWSQQRGARLYRTGDRVYERADGRLVFVGRADRQVKLRGYRIELSEIETTLQLHPQIRHSTVLMHQHENGEPRLIAYGVARTMPVPTSKELREFLGAQLPDYMLPAAFIWLKSLPLNANGKIDRPRLLAMNEKDEEYLSASDRDAENKDASIILPREAVELQLLHVWKELLQLNTISVTDNFFDLGGHSILAVQLMALIYKQFGHDLPLSTLFLHPTIADMAVILRQQGSITPSVLVPLQTRGSRPPLFCVHPSGGTVANYIPLARDLGKDQPFYGLQITGLDSKEDFLGSIEELAAYYITAIQVVQPCGPYFLGGWSMGGVVAFEIAQQLSKQGHDIGLLAIIDSRLADTRLREKARVADVELHDEEFARMMVINLKITLPDDFDQFTRDEKLQYVFKQAKQINGIPLDFSLEQVRRVFQTIKRHNQIAHCYLPRDYQGRIDYFAAADTLHQEEPHAELPARSLPLELWQEVARGDLIVHVVPGNHREMMEEPNVGILASLLRECMDHVGTSSAQA